MKIAVIGAGIAGLVTATRLAKYGYNIEVYESSPRAGGKMYQYTNEEGLSWDTGPTLISLPDEIHRTFDEINYHCPKLIQLNENSHLFFNDGTNWKLPFGKENIISFFKNIDNNSAKELRNVLHISENIFEFANNHLFHKTPPSFFEIALKSFRSSFFIKNTKILMSPYEKVVEKLITNSNLREFFYHFASYIGVLPSVAQSGILSIAHVELNSNIMFPEGGVYSLVVSLYLAALKHGVKFKFNTTVTNATIGSDKKWEITSTHDNRFNKIKYDILISNCDPFVAAKSWLREPKFMNLIKSQFNPKVFLPSESQFVILFDWANSKELSHHTKIFPKSWKSSFEEVCRLKKIPDDPCVYLVWPHATDKTISPRILFISAMAPNTTASYCWNQNLCDQYSQKILSVCKQRLGFDFRGKIFKTVSPLELEQRAHGFYGGIYSASSIKFNPVHFNFSGLTKMQNLFFVGAGVHPGAGVTMVMKSARRIAEYIISNHSKVHKNA